MAGVVSKFGRPQARTDSRKEEHKSIAKPGPTLLRGNFVLYVL
jgi:hypothetical protein